MPALHTGQSYDFASPPVFESLPMLPRHNDPIAAIATAPGRGAVGIVRVSGKALPHWYALCAARI